MIVGGDPFYLKFWVNQPHWSKIADFESIIARKSTMRFPISLRWSSYVAPKSPKGGLKNTKRPICVKKIGLRLKKVCYKVSLCEDCQRQSCKAFIGLTIHAKMIGGKQTPCTWNFESKWLRLSEIWKISCDNSETVRDRMSVTINH